MDGVSLEATIQCPHCEEQFVVGEMLTSTFGTWNIINDPALPHGSVDRLSDDEDEELKLAPLDKPQWTGTGPNRRLVRRRRGMVNPETDWSKFEPITYEQFEKLRRQDSSPGRTMLQVGLGGLAAIPIGLLLIWHVLGTDVMGAGPVVGRYAPWIVPARFRPEIDEDEQAIADNSGEFGEPGEGGFRNFDEELGMSSSEPVTDSHPGSEATPRPSGQHGYDRPTIMPQGIQGGEPAGLAPSIDSPSGISPSGISPSGISPSGPAGISPPGPADDSPREAASGRSDNMADSIRQTLSTMDRWQEAEAAEDKREIADSLYQELLKLATNLHNIPQQTPVLRTMREQMQQIGQRMKQNESLQQEIDALAKAWIEGQPADSSQRPLAWIVEIEEAAETRTGFESFWTITPTDASQPRLGDQPLPIAIPRSLAPSLIPGQRLLLLGTIGPPSPPSSQASSFPASSFPGNHTSARPSRPTLGTGTPPEPLQDEPASAGSSEAENAIRFEASYLHSL
jgi:hypothetical protein